jgi:nitrite reductase (NADH) small subunit
VPPGTLRLVRAGERCYALANLDGVYHAVDNNCPHNGGPLAKGRLIDGQVECPWHCWRWDLASGRNTAPGVDWRVPRVPVRVVGDQILLPVL